MEEKWAKILAGMLLVVLLLAFSFFVDWINAGGNTVVMVDFSYRAKHLEKLDQIIKLLKEIKHKP